MFGFGAFRVKETLHAGFVLLGVSASFSNCARLTRAVLAQATSRDRSSDCMRLSELPCVYVYSWGFSI